MAAATFAQFAQRTPDTEATHSDLPVTVVPVPEASTTTLREGGTLITNQLLLCLTSTGLRRQK